MKSWERAWRGGKNDWRLHMLSVFSVAVAFVCLAAALLVVVNIDSVRNRWASTGRISVFLKATASPDQAQKLETALRATPGVADVNFVSSRDARADIMKNGGGDLLAKLPDAAFPASLELKTVGDPTGEELKTLAARVESLPAVESIETYSGWTQKLGNLLTGGVTAAVLLALVVFGAVVSVVGSTMRLTLQRRRIEVEVLKLVGATDAYVRRPFVVEGAAQGALGASLAIALLGVLYAIVTQRLDGELALLVGASPTFLPWTFVLGTVATGAALGASAAYVSLRRLLVV